MCVKIEGETTEPERGVKVIPTSARADDAAQDGRRERWTPCAVLVSGSFILVADKKRGSLATSQQPAVERILSRT